MIGSKISAPISENIVVYQMVRALIDEEDEDNFHKQCQGVLKYLLEAAFNEFHKYFTDSYLSESRIKLWPNCFRKEVTFHTNSYLENMHKVLKYIYLHGKKVKRLVLKYISKL